MDAFGVERSDVSKDLAGAARWTTKAGKKVALKAKDAPIKAQVTAMNAGERIATSTPKKATKARVAFRRLGGKALQAAAYRPDALALAATRSPSIVQLAA
jgi:hypothetical protein